MKRKIIFTTLLTCLLACLLALCACDGLGLFHTHTFEENYTFDETYHWQKATCGHDRFVNNKAKHVFVGSVPVENGVKYTCAICGYSYVEQGQAHVHTFSDVYRYDKTYHFLPSTCGHNVVDQKAEHTFDGGVADAENNVTFTCTVCGFYYVDESHSSHVHTYSNTYSYNAECHFFASTCGHDVTTGVEPHNFVNGVCKCGYSTDAKTFTFVSLNDVHGYIEQENGKNGISNTAYAIDRLSAYSGNDDQMMGYNQDIVLFANGDMFQGTAISNMSKGYAVVKAMNQMGFVGMGVGNHEFDWGLENVLQYWDGIESNGEANFPLVSSNITQNSANALLGDVSNQDNICTGLIVEKQGVKIGVVSVIGPCENSILQTRLTDYSFGEVVSAVKKSAQQLKQQGAELVSVNIHYGNADGVQNYSANRQIANLTDGNGNYLVDVIFNGHTHTLQSGEITRSNGTSVPVVQGGGYNNGYAMAKLTYEPLTGEVTLQDYGYRYVDDVGTSCIASVENVVTAYHKELLSNLPVLATSGYTLRYKSDLYQYMGKVMVKAFGTDYAISNTGGLRGTGGITFGQSITEANLYEIIPFDNAVYYITMQGSALYKFYSNDGAINNVGSYYYFGVGNGTSIESLKNSKAYYTVAIIDYVYTSEYFTGRYGDYSAYIATSVETHLMLRDVLVEDIKQWGKSGEKWTPRGEPKVTLQYVY